jgi:hypothetical protein
LVLFYIGLFFKRFEPPFGSSPYDFAAALCIFKEGFVDLKEEDNSDLRVGEWLWPFFPSD